MRSEARVTVLMPAYNSSEFIFEAIDSVLKQTYSDFTLLIIDDGSTDDTAAIINSFSDKRIQFVQNTENLRLVATLNKGLDLIESEYMVRMDADDVSMPERIEKLVAYMDQNPGVGVCGSFIETFGKENSVWKYDEKDECIRPCIFYKSMIGHASAIFRMSVLNDNHIRYSEKYIHMEDKMMWTTLFPLTRFHNLQEVLYKYRLLEHNVTVKNRDSLKERVAKFYTDFFSEINFSVSSDVMSIHTGYTDINRFTPETIKSYFVWLTSLKRYATETMSLDDYAVEFHIEILRNRINKRINNSGRLDLLKVVYHSKPKIYWLTVVLKFKLKRIWRSINS